jgi:hypothetical protein
MVAPIQNKFLNFTKLTGAKVEQGVVDEAAPIMLKGRIV